MITSKQNPSFKKWMKLKTKKHRDAYDEFLVYGEHLVAAAEKHGALVERITTDEHRPGTKIALELMEALKQTETTPTVMAVCRKVQTPKQTTRILALDGVQDPDNVGALLRSASAFGFLHVILSPKTADLYNEKVIRASQGALFDLYVERGPLEERLVLFRRDGYQIVYADAHGGDQPDRNRPLVLIMGNEGRGVSERIRRIADSAIRIETKRVESLNVSVAGGIIMHQWRVL
ncbi:MAG: TrmH family RNA methyltransferase [Acholeplasmataceae bacterium]